MGVIFISHSSCDNGAAEAMRDWLAAEGWTEVFLDLDPASGLAPGQRWREELRKAGEKCSAVVVLISPNWAASKWCLTEVLLAAQLGKALFPVIVAPTTIEELPVELTATYQFADISTADLRDRGYQRLRIGLRRAGLAPGSFPWPPPGEPNRPVFRGLRTLEEPDAAIFFGRDAQITKALDQVRRLRDGGPERMVLILGASGAGKSSFLRAGLLARLKQDTERFLVLQTVRPAPAALSGKSGVRIPGHAVARSDDIRSPIPGHPVTLADAAERGFVMSVVLVRVKRGAGRPRHQWEGPARGAACPIRGRRGGARGRDLLMHGGGRRAGGGGHGRGCWVPSPALSLRMEGPSRSRR